MTCVNETLADLQNQITALQTQLDDTLQGPPGIQGPTGGIPNEVATFADIATLMLGNTALQVTTLGYLTKDDGGAARYLVDTGASPAFVASYPKAAKTTADLKGVRLANQTLLPQMFGVSAGTGFQSGDAWATLMGTRIAWLAKVTDPVPDGLYSLPAGCPDPLGAGDVIWENGIPRYRVDPCEVNDWRNYEAPARILYCSAAGNDANDGLTPGTAKKTKAGVEALVIDKTEIRFPDRWYGYLWGYGNWDFGNLKVALVATHPSGYSDFTGAREDRLAVNYAFAASGAGFVSTATGFTLTSVIDISILDKNGHGRVCVPQVSKALALATPGSWYQGGGETVVRLFEGGTPVPFTNCIMNEGFVHGHLLSGWTVLDGIGYVTNGGGANAANTRVQPKTLYVANTHRLCMKRVRSYGGDGNAMQVLDIGIVTTKLCTGSQVGHDIFSFSSYMTNINTYPLQARWMRVYADRPSGYYTSFPQKTIGQASNSNNGSTPHAQIVYQEVGGTYSRITNAVMAAVQGCFVVLDGVSCGNPSGPTFRASYWYQRNSTAEGVAEAALYMRGCDGSSLSDSYAITNVLDDGVTPSIGIAFIANWQGRSDVRLNAEVRAMGSNELLYKQVA